MRLVRNRWLHAICLPPTVSGAGALIGDAEPKVPDCDARTTICFLTFAATPFGLSCDAVASGHGADEITRRRINFGPGATVLTWCCGRTR